MVHVRTAKHAKGPDKHVHTKGLLVLSTPGVNLCMFTFFELPTRRLIQIRYISALEERIAFLEARLPDYAEDHLAGIDEGLQARSEIIVRASDLAIAQMRRQSCHDSQAGSVSDDADLDDGTSLVDGVAYLSLCASGTADTNQEPFYLGSSSGATIARIIQSSIYRRAARRTSDSEINHENDHAQDSAAHPVDTDVCVSDTCVKDLPPRTQARMLFDFFFERIHPRWPLLDRSRYEVIFTEQYSPGNVSVAEQSILHLIYAITTRFLAVTRKPCGVDDEVCLASKYHLALLIHIRYNWQLRHDQWSIFSNSTILPQFSF